MSLQDLLQHLAYTVRKQGAFHSVENFIWAYFLKEMHTSASIYVTDNRTTKQLFESNVSAFQ